MNNSGLPKHTPLYNLHTEMNARLVDFSGWLLPVQYSSIINEHIHTRTNASIFDICHMGEYIIEEKNALEDLENLLTCSIEKMKNFSCSYCFLLNETGGFIDDSILYKFNNEKFMLVVNASRIETDLKWIKNNLSEKTTIRNVSDKTAKIDLQGPSSLEIASTLFPDNDLKNMSRFRFREFDFSGMSMLASTTGYTGEKGFEFFMPAEAAPEFWKMLLSDESVKPAGLGARDSLRLEKGLSLYGHELNEEINPYEAGLDRFITRDKAFIGSKALKKYMDGHSQTELILVPFLCEGRRTARNGFRVFYKNKDIGYVTSGAYSPMLKKGIGLCLIKRAYSESGTILECRADDIEIKTKIVKLPFI